MKAKLKKRKDKSLKLLPALEKLENIITLRVTPKNLVLLIISLVFVDQVAKVVAAFLLPIFCNAGVAFGIAGGGLIFSLLVLSLVLFMIKEEKSKTHLFALCLVFAGGFSNFLDRLFFGCVRDFIQTFSFMPIFNFADVFLSLGVVMFFYFAYRSKGEKY